MWLNSLARFIISNFKSSIKLVNSEKCHNPSQKQQQQLPFPSSAAVPLRHHYLTRISGLNLLPALLAIIIFLQCGGGTEAFARRPNVGQMKLCPPGGQSFAAAWEITCGMRRRKREVYGSGGEEYYGNANSLKTPMEEMHMHKRASARVEEGYNNHDNDMQMADNSWWQAMSGMLFGIGPKTHPHHQQKSAGAARVLSRKERTAGHQQQNAAEDGKKLAKMAEIPSAVAGDHPLYRAPSMTEMMLFCCRYGCSLRDLMPYCDPFGQWDS